MSRFAVNQAPGEGRQRTFGAAGRPRIGRLILGLGILSVIVVTVVSLLTDTLLAMRTEHGLSRALLTSPRLVYDPEVTLGGFPFVTHARGGDFTGGVITARGVPVTCPPPDHCHAELGATLGPFTVDDGFDIEPTDDVATSSLDVYTRLDSVNLGRMLGIIDLTVNTPAPTGKAGAGGPGDGLLRRTSGVLFTGTVALPPIDTATRFPPSASAYPGPTMKVSVTVDLSVVDGRLHITATDFYRGPKEHVDADVPADLRGYVLSHFTATLPPLPLPWDVPPTTAHSEGSDVLLAGSSGPTTVRPVDF
ncbi:LmeA family phospholipid-binding protein [Gordonia rhizosphera]|uniref:DUF2993 domain-containing protein n=1 Tax=Gordonia rhizosphera NBRC 16068 TaxID=1108045 RepID=K6WL47_9ACTN|nr:DUF2993 domain-containing protein [Gordonia rhizosphera]GAB92842.1 hypothetical protein GORHZ_193_00340 [Gordonia rhizosphera NBRC 16068]